MITYNDTLHLDIPPENLHQRLDLPLLQLGFSPVDDASGLLVYRRGSRLKNYVSMSPKGWQTAITIKHNDKSDAFTCTVDYVVNTEGQTVLKGERAYFEQEFNSLRQLLRNETPTQNLTQQASAVTKTNYQLVVVIIAVSALVTFIFVAILYALFAR